MFRNSFLPKTEKNLLSCIKNTVLKSFIIFEDANFSKVSLDRDKKSWENAISEDGLKNWIHISHVKFWNEPIAKLYNVTRMPTTFILNSDKKIIAMDVKDSDLEKIIIKQLSL